MFSAGVKECDAVLHFAGYKSVGESMQKPDMYWDNNVGGFVNLMHLLEKYQVRTVFFCPAPALFTSPRQRRSPKTQSCSQHVLTATPSFLPASRSKSF